MTLWRFGGGLAWPVLVAGMLAGCGSLESAGADGAGTPGPPSVQEVYVEALSALGPHRYADIHIPAVVLDRPPEPLVKPAVMLGDGRTMPAAGPEATPPGTAQPPAPPEPAGPAGPRRRSESKPLPGRPKAPQTAQAYEMKAPEKRRPPPEPDGAVSELRLGALKHAAAFNHTAKETGMDANLEVLFHAPGWLAWAFSPRPTLGLTINASETNTDFLYGGLTWEWAPAWGLFFDLGLGLSVHDGMLDNSQIEGKARFDRREFGCRALFRESVEMGYRFLDRHSLSLMWAHHSHASLCHEENEGIDNTGVRYGYRL